LAGIQKSQRSTIRTVNALKNPSAKPCLKLCSTNRTQGNGETSPLAKLPTSIGRIMNKYRKLNVEIAPCIELKTLGYVILRNPLTER
jgi:hypothetical protein